MSKFNSIEYYPTPEWLLAEITKDVDWSKITYVLEPSAGSGNIARCIRENINNATTRSGYPLGRKADLDCIELDTELQSVLTGKGYRVVHDDFLTFNSQKRYDLIFMNPPFSEGDKHLDKALKMLHAGCGLICILNAETIKNPCTNLRKDLIRRLEEVSADIQFMSHTFTNSDRPTDVEIAIIKVFLPEEEPKEDDLLKYLGKKAYAETEIAQETSLATDDYIANAILMYELEVEAGLKLIRDYKKLLPHLNDSIGENRYSHSMLELKIDGAELSENEYIKRVREKYWTALFKNPRFTRNMTSNLQEEYSSKVNELLDYDFSSYNIAHLQIKMSKELTRGIEDCIIELFDKLSIQYSYSNELSKNIHYYNGWKTNKSWIINKKVIIPFMNAWDNFCNDFDPCRYSLTEQLSDIEKALNYLDNGKTTFDSTLDDALIAAKKSGTTKDIDTKYLKLTFYKKGTCHITFKDDELLKKLNIFGSQQKGWLPEGYGKKMYSDFSSEEKAVIDEFDGNEFNYHQIVSRQQEYIYNPTDAVPMLLNKETA